MEGEGEKTSVAGDHGEAQPLEEKYKERCTWASERISTISLFSFILLLKEGKRRIEWLYYLW